MKVVKGGQVEVVEAHQRAVASGHFTYDDPATGLRVMTRLRHHLKVPPPTFPPPTPPPPPLQPPPPPEGELLWLGLPPLRLQPQQRAGRGGGD